MNGTTPLEAELRRIAREEAQAAVKAALRDAPGNLPRFITLAAYARREGFGASTVRRLAKARGVQRQPNGKYVLAELAAVVERGGKPPPTCAPAAPADLAQERARRALETLTKGGHR